MTFFASDNKPASGGGGGGGTPDDNSVTTIKIVNNAVTLAKMADSSVGTSELVNDSVTNDKMADNSIGTLELIDDSVTQDKLADDSVGTDQIIDDAVTTDKILDDAVTNDKLADDAVDTAQIADNAVTNVNLADNAVNTAEIADNAVTNAKMADNSVNTTEIVNGAVTNDKIATGTITADKLAFSISAGGLPDVGDNFECYWTPGHHINWPDSKLVNYVDAEGSVTVTDIRSGTDTIYARQWTNTQDNIGIGLISESAFIPRSQNPFVDMYFHVSVGVNVHRYHFGFVSTISQGDNTYDRNSAMMNSQSGVVLSKDGSSQTTWRFRRNDGGATFTDSATTYAMTSGWHRVRITFGAANVTCQLDNATAEVFTTELPAATTLLGIVAIIGRDNTSSDVLRIPYVKFGYLYEAAPSV